MASATMFEIFLVIAIIAIAAIVFLGNYKSRDPLPQAAVTAPGYVIRRYWFGLTLVVAVAAFAITIPFFPYEGHEQVTVRDTTRSSRDNIASRCRPPFRSEPRSSST